MKAKLSTQPYKGARDFYPDEMRIRNYMFETWKRVCKKYAFEEYDFPILEPLEIFSAKTGQEIVNDQLFSFTDKGDRALAIRPELTPGTVRMIAQKFNELPKPIKWFMIGNNWRYEKPQTGRGREFYQLECNIFGVDGVIADFEIFSLIIDIMREFGAEKEQFEVRFSDRKLLNALLKDTLQLDDELVLKVRRLMDKFKKMPEEAFVGAVSELGLASEATAKVIEFLKSDFENLAQVIPTDILKANLGYINLKQLTDLLDTYGLLQYCKFDPSIIRGFDYSDGLVYEVFDMNPNNRRSLFGGERFDKLIEIFGDYNLAATGFAMGDWTLTEFLKNWDLLPKQETTIEYFVTVWPGAEPKYLNKSLYLTQILRNAGKSVFVWPYTGDKLDKQLKYADKRSAKFALILGEEEIRNDTVTIKDLASQKQNTVDTKEFLKLQ